MSQNEGGTGQQTNKPGRPGAMTVAMQAVNIKPIGPKVLRIGVIQAGKIIEERIVRKRETVTVGSSERNHFVLAGMPPRFELFQLVGNDYILNFTEQMTGRVGLPAGVQSLEQLRSSGAARNAGSYWQVKLNDNARGKVVFNDTTLLFQFVAPPPVQPRPQLPAAARGGFAKSIDWMFTAFVMFSFMTHFGFVVYLENSDWPVAQGIGVIPPEYVSLVTTTVPPEEPEEPAPTTDEGEEPEPEKPSKAPEKAAEKEPDKGKAAGPDHAAEESANAEKAAAIANEAAAAAEALLLGALGADSGGALQDVLAGGAVTGNAEEVLSQAAGVGVATNSTGQLRARAGGGTGDRVGGLGSLGATGAGGKEVQGGGALTERAPAGRINLEGGEDIGGSGEFDAKLVTAEVKKRLRAIQICYEQQLRRNPGLQGKVVVEFTIEQSGTVSKATATQNTTNDPAVASCVVDTVKRFRFNPGPEGGSVTYSYPFVFAPQS
jgi:TonB family protein